MLIELEERIENSASYINTGQVLQLLEEIDSSGLDTKLVQMLGRIHGTFVFLKEALDKADPWLVSTSSLTNMNNNITNIISYITNFKNDRNEQHLNNIFNQLESLLTYFPQVLVSKTPEEIEGVRSSVATFRKSVGQYLSNLEKDINETSTAFNKNTEKLNELTTSIESQKSRTDSVVSDFQNQFLQAQNQRNEAFNNFLKTSEANFNGIWDAKTLIYDQMFDTQQQSFDSLNEGFQQQIDTQQEAFETLIEELKSKVQIELDQIHAMNQEAEKIVGIISMKGLASGYQGIANSEGRKSFGWNALSIFTLLGILWFGYKFIIMHEGEMSWTALLSRIVLTGVGLTLFTYCAKQAANYRSEERRSRRLELELASLEPFLKDLDDTKQKEIKENLVDKYFGVEVPNATPQQEQTQQQQNLVDSITKNPQLLQTIIEKVTQAVTQK